MDEPQPLPSLPTYATTHHFIERKQQGPLNKLLGKMLAKRLHQVHSKVSRQTVKIKQKKIKYY